LPRLAIWPTARRLVGGETLEKACDLGARLNGEGKRVTLGLLGENVASEREARAIAAEERRALEEIEARGLDAALSVKLSALGLAVDEELCFELLLALVGAAEEKENTVLIDMERSSATDATLLLYRRLRDQGCDNVSLALQARLQRTLYDVEALAPLAPRISICKGGYDEPPEVGGSGAGAVPARGLAARRLRLDYRHLHARFRSDRRVPAAALAGRAHAHRLRDPDASGCRSAARGRARSGR
jgi:proline dehydrogenase